MKRVERLTVKQITELRQIIKSKKSDNVEMKRAQSILLINSLADDFTIENITGFDKRHASKLRRHYLKKGVAGITTRKRKSRPLLKKIQFNEVIEILQKKVPNEFGINADFWTTSILAEFIKKRYNVVYKSKTSYCLIFKKSGFTYHKPEKKYHERNQFAIDTWRKEKLPEIKKDLSNSEKVVLVGDEMILTTQTTTQKVWLMSGTYSHVEASNKRKKRCIYGFLNMKTGQEHAFKTDYTNSLITCDLLRRLISLYPNKKITLVWDNASWHRSKTVKTFLTEHPEKFHLIGFPTYSPEENPQEHVWKAGRSNITHNKFIENIDTATDEFVNYLNSTKFEYKFL